MRASTKRTATGLYQGVVLDDAGKPLCLCIHSHRNRDTDSWDYRVKGFVAGQSALTCANKLMTVIDAQSPDEIQELLDMMEEKNPFKTEGI